MGRQIEKQEGHAKMNPDISPDLFSVTAEPIAFNPLRNPA